MNAQERFEMTKILKVSLDASEKPYEQPLRENPSPAGVCVIAEPPQDFVPR
jgi:hypothetical protein